MRKYLILTVIGALIFSGCSQKKNAAKEEPDAAVEAMEESEAPKVIGEKVAYIADGVTMEGYIAYDAEFDEERPGIIVVHEWWGHNEYARERAEMLAELGYTALAVDMYGGGKTADHPDEAGEFSNKIREDMEGATARFMEAMRILQEHPTTDEDKIAAIGYCFGGGVVLEMARRGLDLDGVVSFHGGLGTESPAQEGDIIADILVLHGGSDKFIPMNQVEAFKEEMEQAGADYEVVVYENATHSFTNPSADSLSERFELPIGYNREADENSWQRMQEFFDEIF